MSLKIIKNMGTAIHYIIYLLIVVTFVARFEELRYLFIPDLLATPILVGYVIALVLSIFRWSRLSINFSLFVVFCDVILNSIYLSQFYSVMDAKEFVVIYQIVINLLLISLLYVAHQIELNKKGKKK